MGRMAIYAFFVKKNLQETKPQKANILIKSSENQKAQGSKFSSSVCQISRLTIINIRLLSFSSQKMLKITLKNRTKRRQPFLPSKDNQIYTIKSQENRKKLSASFLRSRKKLRLKQKCEFLITKSVGKQ